jgi:8-oxo-dGTP pyrophosphatase MutT (NUDIX family)
MSPDTAERFHIDRGFLRNRLAVPHARGGHGDVAHGLRLLESEHLRPAPVVPGQPDVMASEPYAQIRHDTPVPAAVLMPLVERTEGYTVLLTQRTAHLKVHSGQISFPGGRKEEADADAIANALRETKEEIGLAPDHVEIVGQLSPFLTITGFIVTPVVGVVTPPFELTPDSHEVADVFEVPLAFFLNPSNHHRHSRTMANGAVRAYYAMPYGDRYVWGATAAMIMNLYEVLTVV